MVSTKQPLPPEDPNLGKVLAETYQVIRLLGQGGMGRVYEACHTRLTKKRYAVKILQADAEADPEAYARFRREAEIATEIGHPHIVEVYDFNITGDGQPFIVMEFMEGEDLYSHLQRRGELPRSEVLRIMVQVTSGLEAAHAAGVVHRDLKPENIFLAQQAEGDPQAKLLDFGLSKIKHSKSRLTRQNAIFGTPHYMAPEQADGSSDDVDQRSDIYALGVIVYQCLCGEVPFDAPTPLGVLFKVVNEVPLPLTARAPQLPPELDLVLARAMAKTREERYQSVAAFMQALSPILERPGHMDGNRHEGTEPDGQLTAAAAPVEQVAAGDAALAKTARVQGADGSPTTVKVFSRREDAAEASTALVQRADSAGTKTVEVHVEADSAVEDAKTVEVQLKANNTPAWQGDEAQMIQGHEPARRRSRARTSAVLVMGLAVLLGGIAVTVAFRLATCDSTPAGLAVHVDGLAPGSKQRPDQGAKLRPSPTVPALDGAGADLAAASEPPPRDAQVDARSAGPGDQKVVDLRRPARRPRLPARSNKSRRRSPAQKPRRRTREPAGHGWLTVATVAGERTVWANVFLDGASIGRSLIFRKKCKAGRHVVVARRSGYAEVRRKIRLLPGQKLRVVLKFRGPKDTR